MSKSFGEKRADKRERSILRIMSTCVHFTGIQHEKCEAEVNYHDQFGSGVGCFVSIPCMLCRGEVAVEKTCPMVKYPTRAEANAKQDERDAHTKNAMRAMVAAHNDAKEKGLGKGNGGAGELKCPLCPDGMLRYSVAGYNGHMYAGCTNGCVSWM